VRPVEIWLRDRRILRVDPSADDVRV
jgi:hypothetical protein